MDSINLSEYSGSLLGSLTVAVVLGVAWCARNKLKHSKCAIDSKCLKISTQEDEVTRRSTIRLEILDELRRDGILPSSRRSTGETGEVSLV